MEVEVMPKAEPVAYCSERALSEVYCGETSVMGPKGVSGDIALFTAPPPPKIKDHQIREMVDEITKTAIKYQGCQCLRDAISKVVVERLNGLGE